MSSLRNFLIQLIVWSMWNECLFEGVRCRRPVRRKPRVVFSNVGDLKFATIFECWPNDQSSPISKTCHQHRCNLGCYLGSRGSEVRTNFHLIICKSFSEEINLGFNVSQRAMMPETSHDLTTWIKRCGQFIKITRNTTGQMDHFGIISKTILLWSSVQHRCWNFLRIDQIISKIPNLKFFYSSAKSFFNTVELETKNNRLIFQDR